VHFENSADKQY